MAAFSSASGDASPAWAERAAFRVAESLASPIAASAAATASETALSVMGLGVDTRIESIGAAAPARSDGASCLQALIGLRLRERVVGPLLRDPLLRAPRDPRGARRDPALLHAPRDDARQPRQQQVHREVD